MEREIDRAALRHQCDVVAGSLAHVAMNNVPLDLRAAVFVYADGVHDVRNIHATRGQLIDMLCRFLNAPENLAIRVDEIPQVPLASARDAGAAVTVPRTLLRRMVADILYLEGVSSALMAGTNFGELHQDLRHVMEAARLRSHNRAVRLHATLEAVGAAACIDFENEDLDD